MEDALTGVTAGVAAGMRVIACPDARIFSDADAGCPEMLHEYEKLKPMLIVRSLADIDIRGWS